MTKTKNILFILTFSIVWIGFSYSQEKPNLGFELITDVLYGKGKVTVDGKIVERDLLLDVFLPSNANKDYTNEIQGKPPYPVVILVHGGGFQRGGRREPPFKENGAVHSRMEDYAQLLTPLGYVCFVIDYRLAPELPEPEIALDADWLTSMDEAITDAALKRSNFARTAAGLNPILGVDGKTNIWKAMLSAAEDVEKVVAFVQSSSAKYNINPNKIAIGGHSAGGTTVINVAYGLDVPVTAVFPLSPAVDGIDLNKAITNADIPPMLHSISQFDEPAVLEKAADLPEIMHKVGANYKLVWIPGFSHFYPRNAVSLGDDATRVSLQDRLIDFLNTHLK